MHNKCLYLNHKKFGEKNKKSPFKNERTFLGGRSVSNRRPPGPQPGALTN